MLAGISRSPDPNTQVGACIVNERNRILSSGYNSFPSGIGINSFPWARESKNILDTKYPYVVHAEKNAIYNAENSVEGCTLYVTMYPCNECAKDILQARIKKVIYLTNPYKDKDLTQASKALFQKIDLPVEQHKWHNKNLTLLILQRLLEQIRLLE